MKKSQLRQFIRQVIREAEIDADGNLVGFDGPEKNPAQSSIDAIRRYAAKLASIEPSSSPTDKNKVNGKVIANVIMGIVNNIYNEVPEEVLTQAVKKLYRGEPEEDEITAENFRDNVKWYLEDEDVANLWWDFDGAEEIVEFTLGMISPDILGMTPRSWVPPDKVLDLIFDIQ